MTTTSYNSVAPTKILTLAEATWQEFSKFLCKYQWAFDAPSHSPRKTEIRHAILNRGKDGVCTFFRPEGYKYILPVLHPRHFEDAIANHRKIYYVSYGSYALLYFDIDLHYAWQKLPDGHDAKQRIDAMLRKFFGASVLFWMPSSRGFNGFLKVDLKGMGYPLANEVFDRLEAALNLFLASCGNLADFEVKGKIGFMQNYEYNWAHYGKLPIHHKSWNFARLEEFANTPAVSVYRLQSLCGVIERQVPHEVLIRHQEDKISRGDEPIFDGDWFLVTPAIDKAMMEKHGEGWRSLFSMLKGDEEETWLHKDYYRPGRTPLTEGELRETRPCVAQADLQRNHERPAPPRKTRDTLQKQLEAVFDRMEADGPEDEAQVKEMLAGLFDRLEAPHTGSELKKPGPHGQDESRLRVADEEREQDLPAADNTTARQRGPVNLDLSDLIHEPDSFNRQKEALLRYARYLKRVPTDEEALQLIENHSLFTAPWDERPAKRKTRVRDILKFIARTFDPSKCAHGSVNIGKYDEWARKTFPNGLIGGHSRYMDEDRNIVESSQGLHVSSKFIAAFIAVTEFALLIDKNQDNSLPHDRAKAIWNGLMSKGLIAVNFNDRKWAVCREELVKYGIITITDRDYCPGKAMRWTTGTFFPGLGRWKSKKQPSLLGPVNLVAFLQGKREKREEHNTFLQSQVGGEAVLDPWRASRPPPLSVGAF